jgi:hypothetical protein
MYNIVHKVIVMKKNQPSDTTMGRTVSVEELKGMYFGKLDQYFSVMMKGHGIGGKEKEVYELAVRAFINDISYNGLPTIRRARYNREFGCALGSFDLRGKAQEMINRKREYYP